MLFGMRRLPLSSLLILFVGSFGAEAAPRALPEGKLPEDKRLEPLKDLNGHFPFEPSATAEAWQKRAARLRHALQVSVGLARCGED